MDVTGTGPRQSGQWLTTITIVLLIYVAAATSVGLTPVLPQIRAQFAGTPGADFLTKALVTVFGISALIGSPLTGRLLNRWGVRRVFMGTVILYIASGLGGAIAPNLEMLLLTRFVGGLAAAVCAAAYYTYILTYFPPGKRERWLGFISTLGSAWAIVASMLAGELAHHSWRLAFLINLVALPLLVLVPLAFRETLAPAAARQGDVARGGDSPFHMAPAAIVGLLSGVIVMGTAIYVPFQLSATGVSDPRVIARYYAYYSVISAASALAYGYIRRFVAMGGVNFFAFPTAGAGYLLLVLWPAAGLRLVELTVLGLGAGLLTPNLAAFAGRRGDAIEKARSIGIAKAGYFASAFVFQAVMGILAIRAADRSLLALAVICIPGAMIMARVRPEARLNE